MSTIESKPRVEDVEIDDVIKSNEVVNPNLNITQGFYLRALVKKLRDHLETEILRNAEDISNKVDKEDGKGLSTNDFTGQYKNWLDNYGKVQNKLVFTETLETAMGTLRTEIDTKVTDINTSIETLNKNTQKALDGAVRILDIPIGDLEMFDNPDPSPGETPDYMFYDISTEIGSPGGPLVSKHIYEVQVPDVLLSDNTKNCFIRISGFFNPFLKQQGNANAGYGFHMLIQNPSEDILIPIYGTSIIENTGFPFDLTLLSYGKGKFSYMIKMFDGHDFKSEITIAVGAKLSFQCVRSEGFIPKIKGLLIEYGYTTVPTQ